MHFYRKCWFDPFEEQFMSPFLSDCPSLMLGIVIHCIQHSQAMLVRGVCELAHSFFHLITFKKELLQSLNSNTLLAYLQSEFKNSAFHFRVVLLGPYWTGSRCTNNDENRNIKAQFTNKWLLPFIPSNQINVESYEGSLCDGDDAMVRCCDRAMMMERWSDDDEAMFCRVIIFALSRHRHHMFSLSTFCNPREQVL